MYDNLAPELERRLRAASHALPIEDTLREIADTILSMNQDGYSDREIDAYILEWMNENGFGYKDFAENCTREFAGSPLEGVFDMRKLWKAYGLEDWFNRCIRSLAFTDDLIPFFPLAAGYWLEDKNSDPPLLIAVMTPLTDPKLAAKQLVAKHRAFFGDKAAGNARHDEVFNAQMLSRHRSGMSYRDIAIQNLRGQYPDIVRNPRKYKKQLDTERERVVKAIKAAQELWNARGLGDSTP